MSRYLVLGTRAVRGFKPGETFEAVIPEPEERRLLLRGNVRVVEQSSPALLPGSYKLPRGWDTPTPVKEG